MDTTRASATTSNFTSFQQLTSSPTALADLQQGPHYPSDKVPLAPNFPLGFAGVGKLTGDKAALFQFSLHKFIDTCVYDQCSFSTFGDDLDNIYTYIPHELQLQLVAEIAIGLLVPSVPLPSDSVLHHAMFFFLTQTLLFATLETTLDEESMSEETDDDIMEQMKAMFSNMGVNITPDMTPEEKKAALQNSDLGMAMSEGTVQVEEDRRLKKENKKATKKMRFHKADAASLVKAATDAPLTKIASGANSIAAIQKISDRIQAENALVKKNAKKNKTTKKMNKFEKGKEDHFRLRFLFRNALLQFFGPGNGIAKIVPHMRCSDHESWSMIYSMWMSSPTPWCAYPRQSYFLLHGNHKFKQAGAGNPAVLARRAMMKNELRVVQRDFEAMWTPHNAVFCYRVLVLLCGVQIDPYFSLGRDDINIFSKKKATIQYQLFTICNDPTHPQYNRVFEKLTKSDYSIHADEQEEAARKARVFPMKKGRLGNSLWILQFHAQLESTTGSLDSFDDTYHALVHAMSTEDSSTFDPYLFEMDAMNIVVHPKEKREKREVKQRFDNCQKCYRSVIRKDLKKCSGCGIVR
tara:strand:+ start:185 stop:1918 length:1734 start_codon:yes stop_codon:yes gene_type:complete